MTATLTETGAAVQAPPRQLRANPVAVLTVPWIGAGAVLLLWWQDTPPLSGLGYWLTNAAGSPACWPATWWWCCLP